MSEVTLGGDRLGSGNQMKQELHNYGMNSFNQGRDWKSTMAPGILYPCFREVGTNHGTFDIDIDTFVRTLPTKGPLFGSFKMQVDLFNVPFRLYQGILHNNPVDIGLNMNQVYLPKIELTTIDGKTAPRVAGSNDNDYQISTSSLLKYDGISGLGRTAGYNNENSNITRYLQCVPELAYYDIFKNYYSNKQEEKAYVITPGTPDVQHAIYRANQGAWQYEYEGAWKGPQYEPYTEDKTFTLDKNNNWSGIITLFIEIPNNAEDQNIDDYLDNIVIMGEDTGIDISNTNYCTLQISELTGGTGKRYQIEISFVDLATAIETLSGSDEETTTNVTIINDNTDEIYTADIELTPFALKNIDKMRAKLLSNNELGDLVTIKNTIESSNVWGTDSGTDNTGLPYIALVKKTEQGITWNAFQQNGLVVKTYQSDLFNNWLDNSYVDEIARKTKIDTTSGGFTPDTLILQEKIYKLLNRILVGGGTYYDWQEATYGEGVARMCEIPMYIGGMSTEIMFEEVIANSQSGDGDRYQALGSLGGKGRDTGKKGGTNIHVKMDEPGYIIGIVSITPRISVHQGNDWDRTELVTIDDLHKPELDQIGFQDLMAEQLAWWNTVITPGGSTIISRDAVGKQTAWINYQTAMDKVYGDFAKTDGYSFMVLSRNYEQDPSLPKKIADLTTYIDPAKYNYAFAYQDLAAQNFWVQLNFKVISRRKMGAQQLPNL